MGVSQTSCLPLSIWTFGTLVSLVLKTLSCSFKSMVLSRPVWTAIRLQMICPSSVSIRTFSSCLNTYNSHNKNKGAAIFQVPEFSGNNLWQSTGTIKHLKYRRSVFIINLGVAIYHMATIFDNQLVQIKSQFIFFCIINNNNITCYLNNNKRSDTWITEVKKK